MSSYYEKFPDGKTACIDEEIPFEIPEGWEWERWGHISLAIQYGYNAPAAQSGNAKMVRISDIQDNKLVWDTVPYCTIPEKDIDTYLLEPNDILFARTGGTVGKSFLVEDSRPNTIYAGYLIRTRYNSIELCPKYLKAYMESQLYWEQLHEGTIATAQPNCNGQTLSHMLLPIPPHSEQVRITRKLSEIEPIVDAYKTAQERLDTLNSTITCTLKKSILQYAIQGKLVPQDSSDEPASALLERIATEKQQLVKEGKLKAKGSVSSIIFKGDDNKYYEKTGKDIVDITEDIPFDIPDSWSWCRLGTIFQHNTGKALNRADQKGKLLTYITTSNLYWDSFELDNLRQMCFTDDEIIKCTVQKGDLLVCEGGDIGRAAIWPFEEPVRIQNHIHRLRPYSSVATRFFYYTIAHFKNSGIIGGKGIGIQGLSSGALHKLLLPVPPMAEQYRIIEKLDKTLASIMSR